MFRRLVWWWRRNKEEQELNEELQSHLAIEANQARELQQPGADPREAELAARRAFGNLARVAEDTREVWRIVWLEQLWQDVRYGLRTLRHSAGFTAVVVLTLALAVGLNTAVFSVVHAVVLKPLSYPDADRLLWVTTADSRQNEEHATLPDFIDWQDQGSSFDQTVAYWTSDQTVTSLAHSVQSRIAVVSDEFWVLSNARPAIGRLPNPGENDAFVLTHRFFERWFQSDSKIVGKSVELGRGPVTITGVLEKDFRFEFPTETLEGESKEIDALRPMTITPRDRVRGNGIGVVPNVVAKMKPGISVDAARTELAAIRERSTKDASAFWRSRELRVQPLLERVVGREAQRALWTLLAAVAFVLLIACANIANLLLARATSRRKEIAIRASVGAGRARILRQFLVESTLLALLGGTAGVFMAYAGIAVIVRLVPQGVPRLAEASIDGAVLLFAVGASLATAFLFGLVPAVSLWRVDLHQVLKDGARTASAALGSLRARKLLVTAELALSVVLLAGAGLMLKSFWRMHSHPEAFRPERILTMTVALAGSNYFEDPVRQRAYVDRFLAAARSLPGVEAVSLMNRETLTANWEGVRPAPGERPLTVCAGVSEDYLKLMGMQLRRGRWFTDSEPPRSVVINETLAQRDFPGQDPIGKRLSWKGTTGTVVGIVADLKSSRLDARADPEFYVHYSYKRRLYSTTAAVRTTYDPETVAPAILKIAAEIDKSEPLYEVMTLEQKLADSIAPRRFNLFLLGTFASVALLLALIGIYAVISYLVTQRTHEIGVRMALGARRTKVTAMVMRQGMLVGGIGITLGLIAAAGLTRWIESFLYDVQPNDMPTYVIVTAVLAVTILLACGIPALRAARVDPLVALRHE